MTDTRHAWSRRPSARPRWSPSTPLMSMMAVFALPMTTQSAWSPTPAVAAETAPARPAAASWNETRIAWHDYEHGRAEAQRTGKPMMVVVHASWCPYCRQYKTVFQHPDVVAAAKGLVMVLVESSRKSPDSAPSAPEGGGPGPRDTAGEHLGLPGHTYIPRTVFLTPAGDLRTDLVVPSPGREHLVDYYGPEELLDLMRAAVARTPTPAVVSSETRPDAR